MHKLSLISLAALLAAAPAAHAATAGAPAAGSPAATKPAAAAFDRSNPFFADSPLPYHLPAFDKIADAHYEPAFAEGMRRQAVEIEAIANNKVAPTFDNTIVAMERSGALLTRVSAVFYNLAGANTNEAMQRIERDLAPKLSTHGDAIRLNAKLFARIQALYDGRAGLRLDPESLYLLERYHTDFVRAGANLSPADKEKLKAMNNELAALSTRFSQNVLQEANASAVVVSDRAELAGLPEESVKAAADEAKQRGLDGQYVIALKNTTGQPWQADLASPALRKRLLDASLARGSRANEFDNREIVRRTALLRAERAKLLGYANHAAYVIEDGTAKTVDTVNSLLGELAAPAVANARREAQALQAVIDAEQGNAPPGGAPLGAADWPFYAEKVRKARYDFDESQLRPYLELDNVLRNGVFYAAGKLYGLSFQERLDLPTYNPDVRVFEVYDANKTQLGLFLFDPYARANKRGGAWKSDYVKQSRLTGFRPVLANHLNIPKPPSGPTLLTFDEVTTAFHEFGHALHALFSNVRYPRFGGSGVPRDFVEYPSQFNEMWATWPEVLANYARHYQTGAPLPRALLDKMQAAEKFNQGYATTAYLAAALLDQKWHQLTPEQVPADVSGFEAKALKDGGVDFPLVPPRYRTTYFSHIFSGGYAANYYAYLWSEKLDADTVEWFKENGGLTRKNGDRFRAALLSRGGSMDAMQMYRAFRGRDPDIKPLLERRGLTEQ